MVLIRHIDEDELRINTVIFRIHTQFIFIKYSPKRSGNGLDAHFDNQYYRNSYEPSLLF